mgnify:CR=1 FL=1
MNELLDKVLEILKISGFKGKNPLDVIGCNCAVMFPIQKEGGNGPNLLMCKINGIYYEKDNEALHIAFSENNGTTIESICHDKGKLWFTGNDNGILLKID